MATIVSGIASTPAIDGHRHSVQRGAFDIGRMPPCLWRHRAGATCGRITRLTYVGDDLHVRALVEDDTLAAQAVGFSVAFGVLEYSIRNKGRPDYFAEVTKARLDEISLVLNPANPDCVILTRERLPSDPMSDFYGIAAQGFAKASEIVDLIRKGLKT